MLRPAVSRSASNSPTDASERSVVLDNQVSLKVSLHLLNAIGAPTAPSRALVELGDSRKRETEALSFDRPAIRLAARVAAGDERVHIRVEQDVTRHITDRSVARLDGSQELVD